VVVILAGRGDLEAAETALAERRDFVRAVLVEHHLGHRYDQLGEALIGSQGGVPAVVGRPTEQANSLDIEALTGVGQNLGLHVCREGAAPLATPGIVTVDVENARRGIFQIVEGHRDSWVLRAADWVRSWLRVWGTQGAGGK
jgi:hypothetical protein